MTHRRAIEPFKGDYWTMKEYIILAEEEVEQLRNNECITCNMENSTVIICSEQCFDKLMSNEREKK